MTTQTQYVLAPAEMISQCLPPPLNTPSEQFSNDLHLEYSLLLLNVLAKCEADWVRLRHWRESHNDK
ncbi:Rz1-like lysis system protein LysC [Shewanella abyssi]|uniref:Rz1-like lysis system protein LysC n=1 Tax=Shewanella abyssi TaxID=311789 RepID=UPI003D160E81